MRRGTPQLQGVLAAGTFDIRWVADVIYDGVRRWADLPVEDVSHAEDGTSKVQQSASFTIVWTDPLGESIAPREVDDILSPFGTTVNLYQLVSNGPAFSERVSFGSFVVSDTPSIQTTRWSFHGRMLSKGDRIKLTLKDPFYKVQRNRFDVPGVTASGGTVYGEIQRLTGLSVTRDAVAVDAGVPRTLVFEEDRLDAVYSIAALADGVPYMTEDGTLSIRPNAWGAPVAEIVTDDADRTVPTWVPPVLGPVWMSTDVVDGGSAADPPGDIIDSGSASSAGSPPPEDIDGGTADVTPTDDVDGGDPATMPPEDIDGGPVIPGNSGDNVDGGTIGIGELHAGFWVTPPQAKGTLLGVQLGMSAEGVYNRVVIRDQGQDPKVLASAEIDNGTLRARNADGTVSPFGRVPYFASSPSVKTQAAAQVQAARLLARVSRPQAVIVTLDELANPLRQVGDVVRVRRNGEQYLGRVQAVNRSSGSRQQTTKLILEAPA